jgi:preprotein translocase subunit SecF
MAEAEATHLSDDVRPFQIKLDGEVIAEIPDYRTVERVHVMTSSGEAAAPAISFDQDSVDLFIDFRSHLDAEIRESTRDLAKEEIEEVLHTNQVALRLEEERTAGDEQSASNGASDSGFDSGSDSSSDGATDKVEEEDSSETTEFDLVGQVEGKATAQ